MVVYSIWNTSLNGWLDNLIGLGSCETTTGTKSFKLSAAIADRKREWAGRASRLASLDLQAT